MAKEAIGVQILNPIRTAPPPPPPPPFPYRWINANPETAPPCPYYPSAICYDSTRERTILVVPKQWNPSTVDPDSHAATNYYTSWWNQYTHTWWFGESLTYEWYEGNWHFVETEHSPYGRIVSTIVHDPGTGKSVLFGGLMDPSAAFASSPPIASYTRGNANDLWVYDPSIPDWTLAIADGVGGSPDRRRTRMDYDPINEELLMFGGLHFNILGPTYYQDTWSFDLSSLTWTQKFPSTVPSTRSRNIIVYDESRNKLLMGLGHSNISPYYRTDIFEWTGSDWDEISQSGDIPDQLLNITFDAFYGMSYDPEFEGSILMGIAVTDEGNFLKTYLLPPSGEWEHLDHENSEPANTNDAPEWMERTPEGNIMSFGIVGYAQTWLFEHI